MKWARGDREGFLKMLKRIVCRFRGKIIDLWVDRAPWHKGEAVNIFITQHSCLRINYLPAYHPELNPQEILWRTMRYEETTNTFFETIEDLGTAIFKRSQRWKPKKIKSLCQFI